MLLRLSMGSMFVTCGWTNYAVFRDNVQHFAEGGAPTERFRTLHAIEWAVSTGHCTIDAARLRGEVIGAIFALRKLTFKDAAISLRTRAVLTHNARLPGVRATVRASQTGWDLPVPGDADSRLLSAAKPFIASVLTLTEAAVDGDALGVEREGRAPAFFRAEPSEPAPKAPRFTALGLAAIGVAAMLVGCAAATPKPPEPASERALETELEQRERDERPPVVAPPPAWGNKVVMNGRS